MARNINNKYGADGIRWIHPLFKPSKKLSLETGIFSGNKRFSPKYHNQPELQGNFRVGKENAKSNFGKMFAPKLKEFIHDHRLTFSITTVFLSCAFTLFVFMVQAKFTSAPSIYAVNLADFKFPDFNPIDKEKFLQKLSDENKYVINNQIDYVVSLIDNQKLTNAEARKLAFVIVAESLNYGYDPLFVTAIIKSESTFRKHAVSPVGATGLMQIMPGTGKFVSKMRNVEWKESKLKDPQYNIRLGIAYLKYLDGMFKGNKERILVAYNWGPANVMSAIKNSRRFPGSCVKYARSIINNHGRWNSDFATKTAKLTNANLEVIS